LYYAINSSNGQTYEHGGGGVIHSGGGVIHNGGVIHGGGTGYTHNGYYDPYAYGNTRNGHAYYPTQVVPYQQVRVCDQFGNCWYEHHKKHLRARAKRSSRTKQTARG
jgi:hypothetical protein